MEFIILICGLIIKLFEIHTDITIKMISILSSIYNKVYITKPLTSRPSNSERYIVCVNFNGLESFDKDNTVIKLFEDLLERINTNEINNMFLSSILSDYQTDTNTKNTINFSSIALSNSQHISINKMISYINSGNYYGDQYHQFLEEQQKANDFWCATFYPLDNSDMKTIQKNLSELINSSIQKNNELIQEFSKNLI